MQFEQKNNVLLYLAPGVSTRPIELHSHDPLRYAGDMLAWLHQATASEREHITALLKLCPQEGESFLTP